MCQYGRWASKEGGLEGPTLIGEGNEAQRGHWAPKVGGLCDLTWVREVNKSFILYKSVETSPYSRHVLKTLRKSPKGKAQIGQYLRVVTLGKYHQVLSLDLMQGKSLKSLFKNIDNNWIRFRSSEDSLIKLSEG